MVLTGVHIGDYKDENKNLDDLIPYLLEKTNIPRIRLTSLEPIEITDKLLSCYTDQRMCPHFHISLQSTSSSVLKSMKRNYSRKEVKTAFRKIAQTVPEAFVGMDIIAGFPSESQKDFEESYELLKDQPWTNMHVFPYSPRKGTYSAFKYSPLPQEEVTKRAYLLRHLSDARFNSHIKKQTGTRKKTLLFKKRQHTKFKPGLLENQSPPFFTKRRTGSFGFKEQMKNKAG